MARMVDISSKPAVPRRAVASGFIHLKKVTLEKIKTGKVPKGDVLTVAQTAAILAAKRTPELVPLTHVIPLTSTDVGFKFEDEGIRVKVEVQSIGQTGVEMEALVGTTAALLAIWDMVKGLEKDDAGQYPTTSITDVKVLEKVKG
jgi:cyclic pyranopterin phosphate synthase